MKGKFNSIAFKSNNYRDRWKNNAYKREQSRKEGKKVY